MKMNHLRSGSGRPLLLIHGLGGCAQSWSTIWEPLAARHEVIAVDLPGFGATPPLRGETSIRTLCDAVTSFIDTQGLRGVDAVGSSMGARLVLELARRGGVLGSVVSLDPGGFWRGWERHAFFSSIWLSIRAVRMLQPLMPAIAGNKVARSLLLAQFSRRPWALDPAVVLDEMRSYAHARAFDELLRQLAYGETQEGAPRGSITAPLVIGWGRQDRVCFPRQAKRALSLFPDARMHWFERCGHFPHWDAPHEAAQLILNTFAGEAIGTGEFLRHRSTERVSTEDVRGSCRRAPGKIQPGASLASDLSDSHLEEWSSINGTDEEGRVLVRDDLRRHPSRAAQLQRCEPP